MAQKIIRQLSASFSTKLPANPRLPNPSPACSTRTSARVPHQLAVAQAALWGPGAGPTLHALLLALGRPRGEHGGFDGQWGLPEVLMLERLIRRDPPGWTVS